MRTLSNNANVIVYIYLFQDYAVYYDLDLYATVTVSITRDANGSLSRSLVGLK